MQHRPLHDYAVLAYASFLFFVLEIALFSGLRFVTGYFEAHLVLALGLLGLLGGGASALFVRDTSGAALRRVCISILIASPWLGFLGLLIAQPHFWVAACLILVAFLPIGVLIGLAYRSVDAHMGYTAELIAGVIGFVCALLLVSTVREESTLVLASLIAATFAWWYLAAPRLLRVGLGILAVFLLAVFLTNVERDYLNLIELAQCDLDAPHAAAKVICFKEVPHSYAVVRSEGSIVDRIDVLALLTTGGPMLVTAFSGEQNDAVQAFGPSAYEHDARIPDVGTVRDALIIGAGVEGVAKAVRAHGAERITALDINGAIIDLWEDDDELRAYAEEPFAGIELTHADGRRYLAASERNFDLITLMNTHRSRGAGSLGEPDYLHTREAFRLMYERLSPSGSLVIEERIEDVTSRAATERILATLHGALRDAGVAHPERQVALYVWTSTTPEVGTDHAGEVGDRYLQVLVQRTPLDAADHARLTTWSLGASEREGRVMPANATFSRWVWLPGSEYTAEAEVFGAIIKGEAQKEHSIDDRPFALTLGDIPFRRSLEALGFFGAALLAACIVWFLRTSRAARGHLALPLFFATIGLGYIATELVLIGLLQHSLGSVLLALVVSIAGMLLASALSAVFVRMRELPAAVWLLAPALTAAALYGASSLPDSGVDSLTLRGALALACAALAGFALGPFFPNGIQWARREHVVAVPLLVGLNGSALALGVPLVLLATVGWGFSVVALIAVLLYILAVAIGTSAH